MIPFLISPSVISVNFHFQGTRQRIKGNIKKEKVYCYIQKNIWCFFFLSRMRKMIIFIMRGQAETTEY